MNHESMRERLALRLYGELDEGEIRELELHLETCAECRRFAVELGRGLGSIVERSAAVDELPADWSSRLEIAARRSSRARPWSPWLAAAAGFVLGAFALGLAMRSSATLLVHAPVPGSDVLASAFTRFDGANPPPSATSRGQLAQLSGYLHR